MTASSNSGDRDVQAESPRASALHHVERRRQMLAAHPELSALEGNNPWTVVVLFLFISVHTMTAVALSRIDVSLGVRAVLTVAAAYFVGALVEAMMFAGCHELSHVVAVRNRKLNNLLIQLSTVASPHHHAVYFAAYHMKHHRNLGAPGFDPAMERLPGLNPLLDPDYALLAVMTPTTTGAFARALSFNARLVRSLVIDRWLVAPFQAFANVIRSRSAKIPVPYAVRVHLISIALKVLFIGALIVFGGAASVSYVLLSGLFVRGLLFHPCFGVWLSFHNTHELASDPRESTGSMYNPLLNVLTFNLGYHAEHHDFPRVPWNRLPTLHRAAAEFYSGIAQSTGVFDVIRAYLFESNKKFDYPLAKPIAAPVAANAPHEVVGADGARS